MPSTDSLSKPRSLYLDSLSKPRQSASGIISNSSEYFFNWNSLMGWSLFLVYKANYKKFLKWRVLEILWTSQNCY